MIPVPNGPGRIWRKVQGRTGSRTRSGKAGRQDHDPPGDGQGQFCAYSGYVRQNSALCNPGCLPEGFYNEQFKKWDIGDIIGAEGVLFVTQTGELSVKVDDIRLLTKALRPLPEKFHGIADQEIKYRQRYLDLIMSEQSRNTFLIRSKIVAYIRQFLIERQFLEVETPMMQVIPGGATARPFTTFHNALDMELFLRIAPELYLKRLVVGGFERVFEINRNFRNEGLSTRHNPEFTMLEFYQAYAEYHDLMDLTEAMLRGIAIEVIGQTLVTYQGEQYDFGEPFDRMTVVESILHFNPKLTAADLETREAAVKVAQSLHIPVKEGYGLGKVQIEIFEKTVESRLMNPTFITAYPVEVSPLARRNDENPHVTDRFEFFVGGREIANGFTELNDAEDQAARFQKQVEKKKPVMMKPCTLMRTISSRWNTACRPRLAKALVSTVW